MITRSIARSVAVVVLGALITLGSASAIVLFGGVGYCIGHISNTAEAHRFALAYLEGAYTRDDLAAQRPFHTKLRHGVYITVGTPPKGSHQPRARIDIRKRDGMILRYGDDLTLWR